MGYPNYDDKGKETLEAFQDKLQLLMTPVALMELVTIDGDLILL